MRDLVYRNDAIPNRALLLRGFEPSAPASRIQIVDSNWLF
jgi:hypothetical protein